jgi:hypothetical protein
MKAVQSEYNSKRIMAAIVTQEELKETLDNWFMHVASFDPRISKTWLSLLSHAHKKLLLGIISKRGS